VPPTRLKKCAELINNNYQDYSLLDIGCRTMALKPLLRGCLKYYGTDITPADHVLECNLEEGLPFARDASFDIVCALDVLEHLERAHHTFHEALRVARLAVFVSLPNMYHWSYRLRFLLHGKISDKYDFPTSPVLDRHKWLTSYSQALNFVMVNTAGFDVSVVTITPDRGRTKSVSKPLEIWLSRMSPDLFASGILFQIRRIGTE
jgi:hypothetical protein